ncbi:MAG: helix-hairpin-helix domain-containing protein [Bacteroidaceae bacterium]|nr:helix-hairpin-helix domain-containing protein [Bacteroidaceae bacterium]
MKNLKLVKDKFFLLTKADRRVLVFLSAALCMATAVLVYCTFHRTQYDEKASMTSDEIKSFIASLNERPHDSRKWSERLAYERKEYARNEPIPLNLHTFDPNSADSIELLQLGFPKYVAHNILAYRRKGGMFRTPEKLSTVYGMTPEVFNRAKPYISIALQPSAERAESKDTASGKPLYVPQPKLAKGTMVDLNAADTTLLKKVPGIGSGYAKAIVRYREQLGGFVSVSQISEIKSIPSDALAWFEVKPNHSVRKIDVNSGGVEKLTHHPYINFYQAKAIVEYRRKRGDIKSVRQLGFMEQFSEADIKRLAPYLKF